MSSNKSKRIALPRTRAEWTRKAEKVTISSPEKKRRKNMTKKKRKRLHEGEHPLNLTLREVGGWKSGSKIDISHFLLARILFKLVPLRSLKDDKIIAISENVQEISRDHFDVDLDFKNFIDHIATTGDSAPPPGKATDLGVYSLVRHHQLMISIKVDASSEDSRSHGPSGGRRSLDIPPVAPVGESKNLEGDIEESDAFYFDKYMKWNERGHLVLDDLVSNFSEQSSEYSDETLKSMGEDIVNASLVDFLTTITMGCCHVNLDWGHLKKRINLDLGHAKIRTINDGCLATRSGDNIFSIIEAKPFRLMDNPVPTVMQMGLEMMAHIYECETKGQKKSRYFMFSQHYDQVYLTWANFDQKYIDYLRGVYTVEPSFLHLKCAGPFKIFKAADMNMLGHIVLNLTVEQGKGRKEED